MAIDLAETLRCTASGCDADLRGADLRGANLRGAALRRADLRGADLRDSDLRDSDLRDVNLCGANLRGVSLCGVSLCGADLRDADLRDANLYDANLYDADLRGADLYGANLRGANLRGAQGVPIAEDAPARLQAVAATVLAQPDALNMGSWHSDCGTTHCLAGTAIHQAGALGAVLERMHGPALAGLLLLGSEAAQHFYDSNETALEWLRSVHTTTQETIDGNA